MNHMFLLKKVLANEIVEIYGVFPTKEDALEYKKRLIQNHLLGERELTQITTIPYNPSPDTIR